MLNNHVTDQTGCDIEYGDYQLSEELPVSNPTKADTRDDLNSFVWTLLFPLLIIIAILSFGAPCWYCRSYRFTRAPTEKERKVDGYQNSLCVGGKELPQNYEVAWQRTIQEAQRQWRIYQILSIAILPILMKTFIASPTEKCLLADVFGTVALLGAMMQVIAATIYKEYMETFQQSAVVEEWLKASDSTWYSPKSLLFWIFLSTPTTWFWSSIVTGVLSFVVSTWAQGYPGAISSLCPSNHMGILPSVTGISALIALTDVMFMVLTLQSFALNDKN